MSAGSIVISLLMATGSFETDTKRAERRLKAFQRETAKVAKAVGAAFVAAGALVVASFGSMISRGREVIDSQAKLAAQLRTTVESIQVLTKAGDLAGVSLSQITGAAKQLDLNLAKAAQGTGAQADALARLGLETTELMRLPLDDRIARINRALADNVSVTERSAVAAALFGREAAQAMQQLDTQTLAEADRLLELFGVKLSDIDAAKVELANDAMGNFRTLIDGVGNQLTVATVPILRGMGKEIERVAEQSGGLGNVVTEAFDDIVRRGAKVADTFATIARRITVVLEAEKLARGAFEQTLARVGRLGADIASLIPGLDFSELSNEFETHAQASEQSVAEAIANIRRALDEPLPSSGIEEWLERVKAETQTAAEDLAAMREAARQVADVVVTAEIRSVLPPIPEIDTSELEELVDGFRRAARFVDSTRTEVERLEEQIAEVQELAAAGFFSAGRDEEVLDRLNERLERARERLKADMGDDVEELSEFALEAMRGTQRIIADTLRDGFDEGFQGIARAFSRMLDQLVAEWLARDIAEMIFGKDGRGGGLLDRAGGFVGTIFGGGRAFGGPVAAGMTYRINELEPEYFRPATGGEVIPLSKMPPGSGGVAVSVVNNMPMQGRIDQRTATQLAIEQSRRMQIARARLG